jgi:hypothetical protein
MSDKINIEQELRKRSRLYSEEEKEAYINLWRESKLSRNKFCSQEGLSVSTFWGWIERRLPVHQKYKSNSVTKKNWIPVKLSNALPSQINVAIEIILPNGIRIKSSQHTSVSMLTTLVQGLS